MTSPRPATRSIATLSIAFILASCGPASPPAEEPSARQGSNQGAEQGGATNARACGDILARYRRALSSAVGTCELDAECAPYGGLDPDDVCGGATDVATALRLEEIDAESTEAGCPRPGHSCSVIEPACVNGLCQAR